MLAKDLVAALKESPSLAAGIQRFAQALAFQAAQVTACNRLEDIDERLARWLLRSQDRLGGDLVPLTQEFFSHMFGTHQAIVTVAAGMLQKAGLITYTRGSVGIESHTQLENGACEQIKKWKGEVGEVPASREGCIVWNGLVRPCGRRPWLDSL